MATVASLLTSAQAALDGTPTGSATALPFFHQAAILAAATADYSNAILAAQTCLASIAFWPDSEQKGSGSGSSAEWRSPEQVALFLREMRNAEATALGAAGHRQEITYARG